MNRNIEPSLGCPRLAWKRLNMISAACKSCSSCSSSWSSTCSSAGQANSSPWICVNRSRISPAQGGIRDFTMVFTKRSTSCFGRNETRRTLSGVKQDAEVHSYHRIVDPMLQTPVEKTCRQKHFDKSANVFEVAPDRACTNRFVLSTRCPASHAEISESTNQMHITQQHAHLQCTMVCEPTSCTSRQCISLDRFVVHLRLAHWNQNREKRALHGRVAPVQDSSVLRPEDLLSS